MFSNILKELRKSKNITQEELAKMVGVERSTVGKWESKNIIPPADMLVSLSEFFNVSVDYLLGRADVKNPSDEISDALEDDKELADFWNKLKEREDLQLLFKQTKNLSSKDIKQIIRIIKAIEDEEDREGE